MGSLHFIGDVLDRAARGDRSAQQALLEENRGFVRGMLYRLAGPSADLDDLQQTVFLRMLVGLSQVRDHMKLRTWLGAICVAVVRDHLRRQKVRSVVAPEQHPSHEQEACAGSDPHRRLEAREGLRDCRAALNTLSPHQRTAFILRALGHSIDEIGAMMNARRSTTRFRLYWARKTFVRAMSRCPAQGRRSFAESGQGQEIGGAP